MKKLKKRMLCIAALLSGATFLAATCVSRTQQRGPAGPWVGEVTNYGAQPAAGVAVRANIFDASGRYVGLSTAFACPATISPGGHATFEIFVPRYEPPDAIALPLHAEFEQPALEGQDHPVTGEGLDTHVLSTSASKRVALVEVHNGSTETFSNTVICANLRDANGSLVEVGSAPLFPTVLRPGETQTVPIFFNSMPPGQIELFARGDDVFGSSALTFDPANFEITATRITDGPAGRMLVVAGEMPNRSGQDIARLRLLAYAEGAPETRISADFGCASVIPRGATAATTFAIPLERGATNPKPVVVGIEATPSFRAGYQAPTSDVAVANLPNQPDGVGTVAVGATIHNPTDKWLSVFTACATVRDGDGRAIGVLPLFGANASGIPYNPSIPPGGTSQVSGAGFVVGTPASAAVEVSGQLGEALPPLP